MSPSKFVADGARGTTAYAHGNNLHGASSAALSARHRTRARLRSWCGTLAFGQRVAARGVHARAAAKRRSACEQRVPRKVRPPATRLAHVRTLCSARTLHVIVQVFERYCAGTRASCLAGAAPRRSEVTWPKLRVDGLAAARGWVCGRASKRCEKMKTIKYKVAVCQARQALCAAARRALRRCAQSRYRTFRCARQSEWPTAADAYAL